MDEKARLALEKLLKGNSRHVDGLRKQFVVNRPELAKGQKPFAAIVCCSDSRVPPELIFDRGYGELFVVRNAGNVVDDIAIGSIEFAVEHLRVPLIFVLGHERCGAVATTFHIIKEGSKPRGKLGAIIEKIVPAVKKAQIIGGQEKEVAITENIKKTVEEIRRSEIISRSLKDGGVAIAAGKYSIKTGEVELILIEI